MRSLPLLRVACRLAAVLVCGIGIGLGVLGCSDDPLETSSPADRTPLVDLVQNFHRAALHAETSSLDLTAPGTHAQLREGWIIGEIAGKQGSAGSWIWAAGPRSSLEFHSARRGERVISLRCRPFTFEGAARQVLSVVLNGQPIATVELPPAMADHRVELPADLVKLGTNELTFEYAYHRAPRDVIPGSLDRRELAVAWERIEFLDALPARLPSTTRGDDGAVLALPAGSQIDYFARLPAGATLAFDGSEKRHSDEVVLELEIALDGIPALVRRKIELDGGAAAVPLDFALPQREPLDEARGALDEARRPSLARISLRATSPGGGDAHAGAAVALIGPRIEAEIEAASDDPQAPEALDPSRFDPPVGSGEVGSNGAGSSEANSRRRSPNVILFLVDTLRARSLGAYGSKRGTSPRFDAFAANAVLFTRAHANTSWTRPGVASLITGLLPWRHAANGTKDRLSDDIETLAEHLRGAGHATAGIITNGNVSSEFGFGQGFDHFETLPEELESPGIHRSARQLRMAAESWLETRDTSRPFLLYLHASDPHAPYAPEAEYRERFAPDASDPKLQSMELLQELGRLDGPVPAATPRRLESLYDAEIAYLDHEFGLLLDHLRDALGTLDETLVIFTSDHGEEFFEHGWWQHGKTLYDEQLHIPLVMALPGGRGAGTRVEISAQQIDLLPTVLGAAGLPPAANLDGRDLLAQPPDPERPVFALLNRDGRHVESVSVGPLKLIESPAYASPSGLRPPIELYDLSLDPGEQTNLAGLRPVATGYLRSLLREQRQDRVSPVGTELAPDTEATLRALGYIE